MEKIKQFSVDDIYLFTDDEDVDFALGEVYLLAEGNNSHKNPISLDVLKRDAHTMLGKFLIAKYSDFQKDVTTHTQDQQIVGYFPKDGKIQFKEKDGKTFAVFDVLISKLYATPVYQLFKEHNFRNVSAEFSCIEQEEPDENGDNPIEKIMFHGCTILGLNYKPSCEGAEMNIKRFSAESADDYYSKHNNSLKLFSERRKKELADKKTYKINEKELKDTPWGEIDKTDIRDKVMNAENRDELVKVVYGVVEDGWQEAPSEHLKYPLMQLVGDTFYYNRNALSSALTYAKQNDEQEVIDKVEKLYKDFDLADEGGEKMAEKKFDELEGREVYAVVIRKVQEHLGKDYFVNSIQDDKVVVTNEETKERFDIPAEIHAEADDKEFKVEIDFDKMEKSEVQKMGLNSEAIMAMVNAETVEAREEAKKMVDETDEQTNIIMEKVCAMACELEELRTFKTQKLNEEKNFAVDKIMANVKDDLSVEKYEELMKEGKNCEFEKIAEFESKVKSFAYDESKKKNKKKEDIIRMGFVGNVTNEAKPTSKEDVFKKFLK
jgi:hypothetical protein|nr:MAG TPA: hypothetical protein [Caudoviricetes sp.]